MENEIRESLVAALRDEWVRTGSGAEVRRVLASVPEGQFLQHPAEVTLSHLGIAQKFKEATVGADVSALVSGSSAWGAFYAVRNDSERRSDIDLLVVVESVGELESVLANYTSRGLIGVDELRRFDAFRKLHSSGDVDQFSLIGSYDGIPVSVDFLLWRHVEAISSLSFIRDGGRGVRAIRELRANPPRSSGYSIDDLRHGTHSCYLPKFARVDGGYLSDTLVDAVSPGNYHLGVMSFFLGVEPYILLDGSGRLRDMINVFQTSVAAQVSRPAIITREERMSVDVARRAKQAFSQDRTPYAGALERAI